MKTFSLNDALSFADRYFPRGPEKLAEHLEVEVRYASLSGCDGWCLSSGKKAIIRINNKSVKSRQRFTLAHELGHLVLGISPVIGESFSDLLHPGNKEERRVNDFAAELLLPIHVVRETVSEPPVDAGALRRLAKKSHVSEVVAALRVANLAKDIGLENASVLFFKDDHYSRHWSQTLSGINSELAEHLLAESRKHTPSPVRLPCAIDDKVVVASLIENPAFGSATLFIQLLSREQGNRLSRDERRRELEDFLFKGNDKFRMSLQGCFGMFKSKVEGLTIKQALDMFWERYSDRYSGVEGRKLLSDKGREYVKLRLEEWCK